MEQEELIEKCLKKNRKAQNLLYNRYVQKMYGVCLRFAKDKMEADDICQDGFIKVFNNLKTFRHEGSLEGWIRRTMINTAINYYKKSSKYAYDQDIADLEISGANAESPIDRISAMELAELIQQLPDGYRMVFNLSIIEGYTHKEIGDMLNISENTSKSQLSRARVALQKLIKKKYKTY